MRLLQNVCNIIQTNCMELLHEFSISSAGKDRKIQLFYGDLTELGDEQKVDLLVVSAFPGDYTPVRGSLIGSLHEKGLSVGELARDKADDMREALGCWISQPLDDTIKERLHIKRILCFEPYTKSSSAGEVVGNIFRCINNFIFDEALNHIALPIVASGKQKFPLNEMCEALLNAAIFWLQKGLPVDAIKLVHKNADTIKELKDVFKRVTALHSLQVMPPQVGTVNFNITARKDDRMNVDSDRADNFDFVQSLEEKVGSSPAPLPAADAPESSFVSTNSYDVFVSYSHKQKKAADSFVQELHARKPGLKIFYDDQSIPKGAQWLKVVSDAIDASAKVVIFISPEYTASKICWDEFQCAKIREYNSDVELLITIYLKSHDKLPTIFQLNNWIDCREDDETKIKAACEEVLRAIN